MKRLLVIASVVGATLWLGASAPATARSLDRGDDEGVMAKKKKHRDGGTREDEEKEEDLRRAPPFARPTTAGPLPWF